MIPKTYFNLFIYFLFAISASIVTAFYMSWVSYQYIYFKGIYDDEKNAYGWYCYSTYGKDHGNHDDIPDKCNADPNCQWGSYRCGDQDLLLRSRCCPRFSINMDAINTLLAFAIIECLIELIPCWYHIAYFLQECGIKFCKDLSEMDRVVQGQRQGQEQAQAQAQAQAQNNDSGLDHCCDGSSYNFGYATGWFISMNVMGFIFNLSYYLWIVFNHHNDSHLYFGWISLCLRFGHCLLWALYESRDLHVMAASKESCLRWYHCCCQNWCTCCFLPCMKGFFGCVYECLYGIFHCLFLTCLLCCKYTCGEHVCSCFRPSIDPVAAAIIPIQPIQPIQLIQSIQPIHNAVSSSVIISVHAPSKESESLLCNICQENKMDCAFLPCGHVYACMKCAKLIDQRFTVCPTCKTHIVSMTKIYIQSS